MARYRQHRVSTPGQRVELIGRQVQRSCSGPEVAVLRRIVAQDILPSCPEDRDDACQLRGIFDYVKAQVRYLEDPVNMDWYPTAQVLLDLGAGDCDDHTILIDALAAVIGFEVGCRVIRPRRSGFHVYPLVRYPKGPGNLVIPIDTTWEGAMDIDQEFPPALCAYRRDFFFDLRAVR